MMIWPTAQLINVLETDYFLSNEKFEWLHWRIRRGEVPDESNPKTWWTHVDASDKFHCKEGKIFSAPRALLKKLEEGNQMQQLW